MKTIGSILESVVTGKALLVIGLSPVLFILFLASLAWVFLFED